MLFKTGNVYQKVDAKKQMLQMLYIPIKKPKHTEKVMKYKNGMFLKPSSYYK